jgi:uncharacterized membrane protein YkoI
MNITHSLLLAAVIAAPAFAAEKTVKLESLPPAVQAAIKAQAQGATIGDISTEKEKGKTVYEVEAKLNGKGRDITFDKTGAVIETEDEVDLDSIPAAAKAAIQKRATGGAITKVEKLTAGSTVSYEAAIKTKTGRNIEVGVNADGTPHKE